MASDSNIPCGVMDWLGADWLSASTCHGQLRLCFGEGRRSRPLLSARRCCTKAKPFLQAKMAHKRPSHLAETQAFQQGSCECPAGDFRGGSTISDAADVIDLHLLTCGNMLRTIFAVVSQVEMIVAWRVVGSECSKKSCQQRTA